jgi:NADH-quinone oxidoreductase subunit C
MGLIPDPDLIEPLSPDQARVVEKFRSALGDAVLGERSLRGQLSIWVRKGAILDALKLAKEEPALDCALLADVTSVDLRGHQVAEEPRYEVVYNLYSLTHNRRFFLKAGVGEEGSIASATGLYSGANFLEREVFDMMGIRFEGHPNLERILTPDGWLGHPLRKDFPTRSDQFPNVES